MNGEWAGRAACTGTDPEVFFPDRPMGRPGRAYRLALAKARAVCFTCPVKAECLAAHLWEPWGVYGGLDEDERAALRRDTRRPRDRVLPTLAAKDGRGLRNTEGPGEPGPQAERLKEQHPEGEVARGRNDVPLPSSASHKLNGNCRETTPVSKAG